MVNHPFTYMQQKLLCVNSTPHTVSKLPFSPSTFHFPENNVICVTVFPQDQLFFRVRTLYGSLHAWISTWHYQWELSTQVGVRLPSILKDKKLCVYKTRSVRANFRHTQAFNVDWFQFWCSLGVLWPISNNRNKQNTTCPMRLLFWTGSPFIVMLIRTDLILPASTKYMEAQRREA